MTQKHVDSSAVFDSAIRVRTRPWLLAASVLIVTAWLAVPHAQAPLYPAVVLKRLPSLAFEVWPADFNRDGNVDLVAGSPAPSWQATSGNLQVVLGRGDGTFGTPRLLPPIAYPLGVGDFNGDGRTDIVARATHTTTVDGVVVPPAVAIVPSNGDGTFGTARVVDTLSGITFGLTADLNGDGRRDLVLGQEGYTVLVYPGHGDLTFGPPVSLVTDAWPHGGVIADVNADSRPDIIVANRYGHSVIVYRNNGGLLFSPTTILFDRHVTDVVARDINADGRIDLIASGAAGGEPAFTDGVVWILLATAPGTFAAPVAYTTGRGAFQVVVGDFTRDGTFDVATANRSFRYTDDCTTSWKLWDSVSILPGNGNGTFGGATSFALADQRDSYDETYRNAVWSLNTADLNRDGRTDLIVGRGAVLLNAAPAANHAPIAYGGPDQVTADGQVILDGGGYDADNHMLSFTWRNGAGQTVATVPRPCIGGVYTTQTFTLTVDDGHGGVSTDTVTIARGSVDLPSLWVTAPGGGSTVAAGVPLQITWDVAGGFTYDRFDVSLSTNGGRDFSAVAGCTALAGSSRSCTWTPSTPGIYNYVRVDGHETAGHSLFNVSGRFTVAATTGSLPAGWAQADVGAVATAGSATYGAETFTVSGDGADIWGTADAFHYVYKPVTGNFVMVTRVATLESVYVWTKGGVMFRETLAAGSKHATLFATASKGIAFQRRRTTGGTSVHTTGPLIAAPVWLRVERRGNVFAAYCRRDADDGWRLVGSDTIAMAASIQVGLAVSSVRAGTLATAAFDQVRVFPVSWTSLDVGAVGVAGSTSGTTTLTINASGTDIWGTADSFRFTYMAMAGNGVLTARVRSVEYTHAWAKAGVMVRGSLTPGAAHGSMFVTPGKGLAWQSRYSAGALSYHTSGGAGTAPYWVRVRRIGSWVYGYVSSDGLTWREVQNREIPMGATAYVGLAVTAHNNTTLCTATFDNVTFDQ